MKRLLISLVVALGLLGFAAIHHATPVEYVRICSNYGAAFHYIPGTDICLNDFTGDAREVVTDDGKVWRTLLPYPQGEWVTDVTHACGTGKLYKVGNFSSTDFTLNAYFRLQTPPVNLGLHYDQFITKVIMSGGFYDPRIPARSGVNGTLGQFNGATFGLCLRSIDPNLLELEGVNLVNPPYGNGFLPIGCVSNSHILNMPAAYEVDATASYPEIDNSFATADQTVIAGPYLYGKQLVVTTDIGPGGANLLTYDDEINQLHPPLAGKLAVSVCTNK